jgi:hypothetical protein
VISGPVDKSENLSAAAAYVGSASQPGDCIVFIPAWARPGFDYHLRMPPADPQRVPRDVAVSAGGASAREVAALYAREGPPAAVTAALRSCPRIWVVGYGQLMTWHPVPEIGTADDR